MQKEYVISLLLDSVYYGALLNEMNTAFREGRPDPYLMELVTNLLSFSDPFYDSIGYKKPKRNVKRESDDLNRSLASMNAYIEVFMHDPDKKVVKAAQALSKLFRSFGRPIVHLQIASRLTTVDLFYDYLSSPRYADCVALLPGMPMRMEDMKAANERLREACIAMDRDDARDKSKQQKLLPLKRQCAIALDKLYRYLQTMAEKDPEGYGDDYGFVGVVIKRMNAYARRTKSKSKTKKAVTLKVEEGK